MAAKLCLAMILFFVFVIVSALAEIKRDTDEAAQGNCPQGYTQEPEYDVNVLSCRRTP